MIAVFIGCGLGGAARFAIARCLSNQFFLAVPAGTLLVNVTGSALLGFLFALFQGISVPPALRLFFTTGFLGGFTTFSTYALETFQAATWRDWRSACLNLILNNVLALIAVAAGFGLYQLCRSSYENIK